VWVVVDAVERCPVSLPARPTQVGQLIAGQCPVVVCPDLQACPSPFRTSPLYIARRSDAAHADPPDARTHEADAVASTSLRPPGPRRLLHPGESPPEPRPAPGPDADADADAAAAGLVRGIGPAGAGWATRAAEAAAAAAGRRAAAGGEERVRIRISGPAGGGAGRRAFGEEGYYAELRVVGYKSSLVAAAVAILLCRSR
jgi:hypothetical protein